MLHDAGDGCITDGDDHVWLGNKDVLKGGGGWQGLTEKMGKGKHPQGESNDPIAETESEPAVQWIRYIVEDEDGKDDVCHYFTRISMAVSCQLCS